jgi:phenylacetate-CoA ligase
MDDAGLRPYSEWDIEDFRKLPLLTRDDIRSHGEQMVARGIARSKIFRRYTSGTTSTPLRLYGERAQVVADWAHWTRFRDWCGFRVGEPRVTFNGRIFIRPDQQEPPFWRYNAAERQLLMSSFHISEASAESYLQQINQYRPVHIDGYVSSLYTLAKIVLERGISMHSPRSVSTYSETLFPQQKQTIARAFGCRVHNQYGHSEGACWAGECAAGGLHIGEEYGLLEIIKEDGTPARDGEQGEIVVTSYHLHGMPLIRYATSDVAVASGELCPCGRGSRLIKSLVGRVLDIIVTPSGRHIAPTALTLLFDKASVLNIKESQVAQTAADRVVVRVVPNSRFNGQHRDGIIADLRRVLGDEMAIEVEVVEAIPRSPSGKLRFVIREDQPRARGQGHSD